ncbi:MAG TPA: hypothetical protein DDX98_14765 [Bacteroidales bacterium]|jgi:hypothetical protein|nr:hypothetical protein [Bacteroidales bacterium]
MRKLFSKKYFISSILVGAWFVLGATVYGQADTLQVFAIDEDGEPETIIIDDDIAIDTARRTRNHSPRLATISSAIVPGLGQVYNQKYWKVPLIWGGGLALYTYYNYNNNYYHRFKLANEQYSDGGQDAITDPEIRDLEQSTITQYKDYYRRHRDRAIIFMGLLYVANIIDAMVDAHMLDYDISQDLSLHWHPTITPPVPNTYAAGSYGVYIQLRF